MSIEIGAAETSLSQAALKGKQPAFPSTPPQASAQDVIRLKRDGPAGPELYTHGQGEPAAASTSTAAPQQTQTALHQRIDELGAWLSSTDARTIILPNNNQPHSPDDAVRFANETTRHVDRIQRQFHRDRIAAQHAGDSFPPPHIQRALRTLAKHLDKIDIVTHVEQNTIRNTFGSKQKRALVMLVAPLGKTNAHTIALNRMKELRASVAELRRLSQATIPACPKLVVNTTAIETLKTNIATFRPPAKVAIPEHITAIDTFTDQTQKLLHDIRAEVRQNRRSVERGQANLPDGYLTSKKELNGMLYQIAETIETKRLQIRKQHGGRIVRRIKAGWNKSSDLQHLNASLEQLKLLYPDLEGVAYHLNRKLEPGAKA